MGVWFAVASAVSAVFTFLTEVIKRRRKAPVEKVIKKHDEAAKEGRPK